MAVSQRWAESGDETTATLHYVVTDAATQDSVIGQMLGAVSTSFGNLTLSRINNISLIPGYIDKWTAEAKYALFKQKQDLQAGENEFTFTNGSRQVTRTIAISSRVYGPPGVQNVQMDDLNVIGWNKRSGTADGVQVSESVNTFGWTSIVPFTTANQAWVQNAGRLRGTVNASSFFGYPPGEVQFLEMRSTVRAEDEFRIEMSFAQAPNEYGLDVGGITVALKKAWEVIDADNQQFTDVIQGDVVIGIVPRVSRVKVHQVMHEADWSILAALLGV